VQKVSIITLRMEQRFLMQCQVYGALMRATSNPKIIEAITKQVNKLDFAPSFNTSHKSAFEFSDKIINELLPNTNFKEVFFTMCGSTAVDTALKIALAYYRARGEGSRVRFIGRERGYHGVGFGGIGVGGILPNRKAFSGNSLPFVDHIPHTHSLKDMAYSRGLPTWGKHLAEELERLVLFHDPSTIAAVIIEPVAGSTGVLVPPEGYLKRIREICTKHDILLIFDEVITGFGRVGGSFATTKYNIQPDIITCAKGLTNGVMPAGAVICHGDIFDTMQKQAHKAPGTQVEFFHGYTYSAHPLAMAAGIATLDVYREQKIFENVDNLAPYFEESLHKLKGLPYVVDIRNCGFMGAVEFEAIPGFPIKRVLDIFNRCFEKGVFVRSTGSVIALSPPLVCEKKHIDQIVDTLRASILESAANLK